MSTHTFRRSTRLSGQRGFALIELTIALLIGTLLLVWGSAALMRRADDTAAQSTGVWLLEIRHAAYRMLERHFVNLSEGSAPVDPNGAPLYADFRAPTLAEFKAQGLLPSGFPESAPTGGTARIRLSPPSGCPGDTCRIDALIYSSQPLSDAQGQPDMMRMALLTEAAAGYGGYVTPGASSRLRGRVFDFPNPYAPGADVLAAGTPVLWAGMDSATANQYVRRFDDRDPQLKGGLTVTGNIDASGQITGSRLWANEYLQISGWATPGAGCGPDGLMGRTPAGSLLSCQSGVWTASAPSQIVAQYFPNPGGGSPWVSGTVVCPGGYKVTGGGGRCISGTTARLTYSSPAGDTSWYASCDTGQAGQSVDIEVYAVCMMR